MTNYATQLNSNEFRDTVNQIIKEYDIQEIVETGTFHGDGSTRIFAETGLEVFTIECNPQYFEVAKNNLKQFENVCCLHGFSLTKGEIIDAIMTNDYTQHTTYDHKFSKAFYLREINFNPQHENLLRLMIDNENRQLVFLDSAGGVGWAEFNEVLLMIKSYRAKNKVLMMDDVSHIKHCQSVKYLEDKGVKVNYSTDRRFAWVKL